MFFLVIGLSWSLLGRVGGAADGQGQGAGGGTRNRRDLHSPPRACRVSVLGRRSRLSALGARETLAKGLYSPLLRPRLARCARESSARESWISWRRFECRGVSLCWCVWVPSAYRVWPRVWWPRSTDPFFSCFWRLQEVGYAADSGGATPVQRVSLSVRGF